MLRHQGSRSRSDTNGMKLKWLVPIVILVLGIVVWMLVDDTINDWPIKNAPAEGETIVAFGDSLVAGVGARESGGFVSILSERISIPIINRGRGGDTTASALTRIAEVTELEPDMVLVLLGGNDAISQVSHEETFAHLRTIIIELQESGAVVVLLGVRGSLLGDEYKDHFREIAEETGSAYVPDVLDGLFGSDTFMTDRIHPNDAGHERIADRVEPIVRELLQSR